MQIHSLCLLTVLALTSPPCFGISVCEKIFGKKKNPTKAEEIKNLPKKTSDVQQTINKLLKTAKEEQTKKFLSTVKTHVEFLKQSGQISEKMISFFNQHFEIINEDLHKDPQRVEIFIVTSKRIQRLMKTPPEKVAKLIHSLIADDKLIELFSSAKRKADLKELRMKKLESILLISSSAIIILGSSGYFYFYPEDFKYVIQPIASVIDQFKPAIGIN